MTTTNIPSSQITTTNIPSSQITTTNIPSSQMTTTNIPSSQMTTTNIPSSQMTTTQITTITSNTGTLRNLEQDNNEFIKDLEELGGYIENYNCNYLKNEVQILYDALYEASIESRISCALCCCIGFFGELSIIFYLLVMYHYNNEQFNEGIINNSKSIKREKKPKFDMESQNEFMDKTRPANIKKNNKKLDLEFNFKL